MSPHANRPHPAPVDNAPATGKRGLMRPIPPANGPRTRAQDPFVTVSRVNLLTESIQHNVEVISDGSVPNPVEIGDTYRAAG